MVEQSAKYGPGACGYCAPLPVVASLFSVLNVVALLCRIRIEACGTSYEHRRASAGQSYRRRSWGGDNATNNSHSHGTRDFTCLVRSRVLVDRVVGPHFFTNIVRETSRHDVAKPGSEVRGVIDCHVIPGHEPHRVDPTQRPTRHILIQTIPIHKPRRIALEPAAADGVVHAVAALVQEAIAGSVDAQGFLFRVVPAVAVGVVDPGRAEGVDGGSAGEPVVEEVEDVLDFQGTRVVLVGRGARCVPGVVEVEDVLHGQHAIAGETPGAEIPRASVGVVLERLERAAGGRRAGAAPSVGVVPRGGRDDADNRTLGVGELEYGLFKDAVGGG